MHGDGTLLLTSPDVRPTVTLDAEYLARQLEATGFFRMLRRLTPPKVVADHPLSFDEHVCCLVDIETNPAGRREHDIIELAMVLLVYDDQGRPGPVIGVLEQLQEPSVPLSTITTRLTGITDAAVTGHRFDLPAIAEFLDKAEFVVSHNALRDRPLLEALSWDFAEKPWACSIADVPWTEYGVDTSRLVNIAEHYGFFFRAHRAAEDCTALLAVLGATTPRQPRPAFHDLLASVKRESVQVDAIAVPYAHKDMLKRRRYRWIPDSDGRPAAWRIEVAPQNLDAEIAWLDRYIYCGSDVTPLVRTVTAVERYRAS